MKFKQNIQIIFNSTIIFMLESFEEAVKRAVSSKYEPTCTSGMDGKHSADSGHYFGRALDFRSSDIPFELRVNAVRTAQEIMGPSYLVILEESHIHVQRDKNSFNKPTVPPLTREV